MPPYNVSVNLPQLGHQERARSVSSSPMPSYKMSHKAVYFYDDVISKGL